VYARFIQCQLSNPDSTQSLAYHVLDTVSYSLIFQATLDISRQHIESTWKRIPSTAKCNFHIQSILVPHLTQFDGNCGPYALLFLQRLVHMLSSTNTSPCLENFKTETSTWSAIDRRTDRFVISAQLLMSKPYIRQNSSVILR